MEVERPKGLTSATLDKTVDLSAGNREANFSLRAIEPSPAGGTVTDRETNEPVEGVTVRLNGPGIDERTTNTLADGSYLFDNIPAGDGYVVTIDVPGGFQDNPTTQTFNVPENSETPITGLDFDLIKNPTGTLAGTVTDTGGDGVAEVLITVTGPDDQTFALRTEADGKYTLAGLPPGDYTITVTAPIGTYSVVGTESRSVTIPASGGVFTQRDFEIKEPTPVTTYAISGTVLDPDGDPVPDATVSAESADGDVTQDGTVDSDGHFTVPGLPAGEWEVTVTPPATFKAPPSRSVTITDSNRRGIAFTLTPKASASPTPAPTSTVTVTAPPPPAPTVTIPEPTAATAAAVAVAGTALADTGAPSNAPLVIGIGALLIGSGCLLLGRRRSKKKPL